MLTLTAVFALAEVWSLVKSINIIDACLVPNLMVQSCDNVTASWSDNNGLANVTKNI